MRGGAGMTARKKVHAEACAPATATTVAGPRQFCSASTYDGAELRHLSNRPGAYDAMAIPSLINGPERNLYCTPTTPQATK